MAYLPPTKHRRAIFPPLPQSFTVGQILTFLAYQSTATVAQWVVDNANDWYNIHARRIFKVGTPGDPVTLGEATSMLASLGNSVNDGGRVWVFAYRIDAIGATRIGQRKTEVSPGGTLRAKIRDVITEAPAAFLDTTLPAGTVLDFHGYRYEPDPEPEP